jgi:hypothetical protein
MGTSLTGLTPATTYDALIKVGDNGPLSATAKVLSDGLGNDSILALSTTAVGIGTNSPVTYGADLAIQGSGNGIISVGQATSYTTLQSNGQDFYLNAKGTGNIIFRNGSSDTERMRITSAGNVGIGTSSPVGFASDDIVLQVHNATASPSSSRSIFRLTNSYTGSTFGNGSGLLIDNNVHLNVINYENADIVFLSNNGTSVTEKGRFLSGGGLTFNGDTAQANALDDYEEGTFTPSVAFGGASTGITYFDRQGNYTKIGRQVTCTMYIAMTNVGSSTGIATIEGLPFTCSNLNRGSVSAIAIRYDNITSTGQLMGNVVQGSTQIGLSSTSVLGADTALNNTNFNGSSEFNAITVTYFV